MSYRYELQANQFALRVYEEGEPDHYISEALIRTYGDEGWISMVLGDEFYLAAQANIKEFMLEAGVKTLAGYVSHAHARAMRMLLKNVAVVDVIRKGMCAGREMSWVIVRLI